MESETDALYRRLRERLDRMPIGFPATESGVEIRILRRLFTPQEAEVALELSAFPEPVAVIHKRVASKMALADLAGLLEQMSGKGIILRIPAKDGPRFAKMIFAIGFYERQLKRLTPELERDAREYMEEGYRHAFHSKKTTQMRIVPVRQSIPVERNVATYEDIRTYVESHPGPFAKMTCICRHGRDLLGEKCKQTDLRENCLMIGPAALQLMGSGLASAIERQEMLQLLDAAEKDGLVLQPENTRNPLFVCCCCGCCCGVLNSAKRFPQPAEYFSANYYAEIDEAACESCGTCETRCQMEAIAQNGDKSRVDRSRCIGCGLCVTTCPSDAIRMVEKESRKVPPSDTRALYMKLLQQRYGSLGVAKMIGQSLLGKKI